METVVMTTDLAGFYSNLSQKGNTDEYIKNYVDF